jgi:hypothetical protein
MKAFRKNVAPGVQPCSLLRSQQNAVGPVCYPSCLLGPYYTEGLGLTHFPYFRERTETRLAVPVSVCLSIQYRIYKLSLTNQNYKYDNYTRNLVGRSFGR